MRKVLYKFTFTYKNTFILQIMLPKPLCFVVLLFYYNPIDLKKIVL